MSVLRLVQFTDTHLYGSATESLRGVETLPALERALEHAKSQGWPPDAILVTGDIVQDDPGGYAHFRRIFGSLGAPVFCIPGNHDDPAILRRELDRKPFAVGGFTDIGPWRLVMLDSTLPGAASGRLSARELALLEAALSSARDKHALVCLHHHPVPMESRWLDQVALENAEDFLRVIDRHRNVRAVVWGHVHQSFESLRKGVRFLATPSTCAQFLPHADEFAVDQMPPGYRTLELRPDGTLVTEVFWVNSCAAGSSSSSVCSAA